MLGNALKRTAIGFLIGMAVGNLIAALTGHPEVVSPALVERAGSPATALLLQTLLSGAIGAVGMGGTVLYEIDQWPLLAIDLAHYLLVILVFLPVSWFLGWVATGVELAVMAAIMFAVHFSIFLILCAIYRAQVKKLNEIQHHREDTHDPT